MHTEWLHKNASGGGSIHHTREDAEAERERYLTREHHPLERPSPPSLGIWQREVTEWEQVEP